MEISPGTSPVQTNQTSDSHLTSQQSQNQFRQFVDAIFQGRSSLAIGLRWLIIVLCIPALITGLVFMAGLVDHTSILIGMMLLSLGIQLFFLVPIVLLIIVFGGRKLLQGSNRA